MILFLANIPTHPTLLEALEFLGLGQIMVLVVLGSLLLLISTNGFFFSRVERANTKKKATAEPKTAPKSTPQKSEDQAIPAVIAAAVTEALDGQNHQILRVSKTRDAWASEGRRQIFTSHRLR